MTKTISTFNGYGFRELKMASELLAKYLDEKDRFAGSNDVSIIHDDESAGVFLRDNASKKHYKVTYTPIEDRKPGEPDYSEKLVECDKDGNTLKEIQ